MKAHSGALCASGVSFGYSPKKDIIRDIQLSLKFGEMLGIIGPNGSGKSTLLRVMSGYLIPRTGTVEIQGDNVHRAGRLTIARKLAMVGQATDIDVPFSVNDLVQMGTFAWKRPLDRNEEESLLRRFHLWELRNRPVTALSGGERQRALLAQALAQRPSVLFLDEPTSHLDLRFQIELLDHLGELRNIHHLAIAAVLHDLNLAAAYCDRLLLLAGGEVQKYGTPAEVLTEATIADAYGVEVVVSQSPEGVPRVAILPPMHRIAVSSHRVPTVHVVGGGGSASVLMCELRRRGYKTTLAPVNSGDSDQRIAERLQIPYYEAAPFSPLNEDARQAHRAALAGADAVVLACVPFGPGNLANLEELTRFSLLQRPLFVLEDGKSERDFTDGKATELLGRLKKAARLCRDEGDVIEQLESRWPVD